MFHLGVIDHVRLDLECAARNYTVHAEAAERLARLTSRIRIGVLVLIGVAAAATIVSLVQTGRPFQVTAVVSVGAAFGAFASYMAVGLEGRVLSHRALAHRLLVICERYRALLAEIQDGLVDRPTILARRDELSAQVHGLYEQPFPPDQVAYETMRQPEAGSEASDAVPVEALPSGNAAHADGSVAVRH
jgi:hypothetical protein